jgi:A/G-specific adenine glycosylase
VQQLIDKKQPGNFNQAIMEFGAIQCKPQKPDCTICPLNLGCVALQKGIVNTLPVKIKKITIKKRFFNYLIITNHQNKTILQQRKKKGIWQNLYEFPLIETSKEIHLEELLDSKDFHQIIKDGAHTVSLFNKAQIVHKLTHQHLYTKFWIISTNQEIEDGISWNEFEKYPVPILLHNFVENFKTNA